MTNMGNILKALELLRRRTRIAKMARSPCPHRVVLIFFAVVSVLSSW